jgi:16S rRNA (uracil1498-N3)-methyltransferase
MRSRAEASPSYIFAPDLPGVGQSLELSEAESRYLVRVCRARQGDRATATDGCGTIATLRLDSLHPRVRAEIESVHREELRRRAWVWCGAPEGERADWLVEKLAELGVTVWQPIQCERGRWRRGADRQERWRRLAIAALRQSRRRHLMEVREPIELEAALSQVPDGSARWLATIEGGRCGLPDPCCALSVGAIGPAGGLSARDQASLEASGFRPICLSENRLRTETAALAWAVWWSLA